MSKDVDVVQLRDDDGEFVYAKTHLDAIDGMEEYTEGLTQVWQFIGDYVDDSGWVPYDYNVGQGVEINTRYSSSGFTCGIRETVVNPRAFGNGKYISMKRIRINAQNFTNGMQLFQLPTGFVTKAQRFQMTGNGSRLPYILEILPDGRVIVFVHTSEQSNSAASNWLYGEFTWIE